MAKKRTVAGLLLALGIGLSWCGMAEAQKRTRGGGGSTDTTPRSTVTVPSTPTPHFRYVYPLAYRRRDEIVAGLNPSVRVLAPTRFDWEWAMPPGLAALTPKTVMAGYDSTQVRYQLFVPPTYRPAKPSPLILFLSGGNNPEEFASWAAVCRKHAVLYASAHEAGDNCPPARRLRIALDVLDDIRRRMNVDTDRIYVGGFSEGARTACEIVYAYPEFVGGLVAVGGGSPMRGEPWLRDRVQERGSVALVTGNMDYARTELERYRYPVLHELEIRAKMWIPAVGHAMPPAGVLEDVFVWLELDTIRRRVLGVKYPLTRIPEGAYPAADTWSNGIVEEAKARLADDKTRESGLMQLEGVIRRWKGSEAARNAEKILADNAGGAGGWQNVYARRQRQFFFAEAQSLDSFLEGDLPLRDQRRKAALLKVSLDLWKQVLEHGADTREGKLAKKRVEELKKALDD
jgi:predicted esterase